MVVHLTGEVNDSMYAKLLEVYGIISTVGTGDSKTLDIFLNTEGGDVYQGFAIYDLIELIKKYIPVRVICAGLVASSGVTILMAGSERLALKHSTIMVHYGEATCNGIQEHKFNKVLIDSRINMMYNNLLVSKRTIISWHDGDHFFDTTRALDVGLIDEVI